jgi:lysophospholipase L1-like esterase
LIGCLLSALLFNLSCSDSYKNIANLDAPGTTIVCFGDSITAGYGVRPQEAFPALIAESLEIPVINAGVDGDTTTDALSRLGSDALAHSPRLVIVEFGGNDFRKRVDKRKTFENLDAIVGRIAEDGAIVVVLGMRIGLFKDEYLSGYEGVAEGRGALLIPNFMAGILGDHKLTTDGIHPNVRGHEIIADRVVERLIPLLRQADLAGAGKRPSP